MKAAASAAGAAGSAPGDGDVSSYPPLRVGADSGRKLSAFERHLQGGSMGFILVFQLQGVSR